jgi:hypothetical protein
MPVCVGLTILAAGFLDSYWSAARFLKVSAFASHGWRIVQILRQLRGTTTNTAPTTLSAIQAASQSTFINEQIYSPCD